MSPLVYLLAFIALSALGAALLWLRERRPRSMESHMKAFERELQALSPDAPLGPQPRPRPPQRRGNRPSQRGRDR